jgi:hypothetical protein
LFVGYRISSLICIKEDEVDFFSEEVEKEIRSKFDDGEIDSSELTPELLSLITDLDYIQFGEESLIGVKITNIVVGREDVVLNDFNELCNAENEVKSKIENLDPNIVMDLDLKVALVDSVRVEE